MIGTKKTNSVKNFLLCMFLVSLIIPVFSAAEELKNPLIQGSGLGTSADPYIVPRLETKISIDGKLDEKEWEKALKFELPYETWPGDKTPAPVRTECYLTYDTKNIYIAYKAFDNEPRKIRAHYYERENIWNDDFIVAFLDTFNEERQAYAIRSNAYGVQTDDIRTRILLSIGTSYAVPWDAIYESKGRIYDWGYAVEMAIPFNQLRFQQKKDGQVWGFNARRIFQRDVAYDLDLIPINRSNNCVMCQYVKIKGFEGVSPGLNLEVVPTLTATRTDYRPLFPNGKMEKRNQKVDPGVTVRWGVTPNISLTGTVNPDFSQVESDSLQLDVNQPFALYYEERRPFFLEGADHFSTFFDAVYTRTMHSPEWGFKLDGKSGSSSFAAYIVRDEVTNMVFPGPYDSESASLDSSNTSSVVRYKYNLGFNYTLGLLATAREGDEYYNRLGGIDGEFRVSRKDRLQFQVMGSSTKYSPEIVSNYNQKDKSFGGSAFGVRYSHETMTWDASAQYQNISNGFRSDLGYIPQVGIRVWDASIDNKWFGGRDSWFRQITVKGSFTYTDTQEGDLITSGVFLLGEYSGLLQSHVQLQVGKLREAYYGKKFDQYRSAFAVLLKPSTPLDITISGAYGEKIDYYNVRKGPRIRLSPEISIKPDKHFQLYLSYSYERLNVKGSKLYTYSILETRGIYYFNVRTFLRAILQYSDTSFNQSNFLYPLQVTRRKTLASQVLFSYMINPRTVFYAGYSNNYLGTQAYSLTQNLRTFFVKLSYAWLL